MYKKNKNAVLRLLVFPIRLLSIVYFKGFKLFYFFGDTAFFSFLKKVQRTAERNH